MVTQLDSQLPRGQAARELAYVHTPYAAIARHFTMWQSLRMRLAIAASQSIYYPLARISQAARNLRVALDARGTRSYALSRCQG